MLPPWSSMACTGPLNPLPIGAQAPVVPKLSVVQDAIRDADTPLAVVKSPPATSSVQPLGNVIEWDFRARTVLLKPVLMADQDEPSHRATRLNAGEPDP